MPDAHITLENILRTIVAVNYLDSMVIQDSDPTMIQFWFSSGSPVNCCATLTVNFPHCDSLSILPALLTLACNLIKGMKLLNLVQHLSLPWPSLPNAMLKQKHWCGSTPSCSECMKSVNTIVSWDSNSYSVSWESFLATIYHLAHYHPSLQMSFLLVAQVDTLPQTWRMKKLPARIHRQTFSGQIGGEEGCLVLTLLSTLSWASMGPCEIGMAWCGKAWHGVQVCKDVWHVIIYLCIIISIQPSYPNCI